MLERVIGREGRLVVYWLPLTEPNRNARVVLVGLTPGRKQAELAITAYKETGDARAALRHAAFAGMRRRMCGWLDDIGVADWLALASTAELFETRHDLLHSTSLIRYPVFVGKDARNYSGMPRPMSSPLLRSIVEDHLLPELELLSDALVVPLGVAVSESLRDLEIDALYGFPHPSGANGHGPKQFAAERRAMRKHVKEFAKRHP
jgi:hypothetical protein